jgi:hypothetical protein
MTEERDWNYMEDEASHQTLVSGWLQRCVNNATNFESSLWHLLKIADFSLSVGIPL